MSARSSQPSRLRWRAALTAGLLLCHAPVVHAASTKDPAATAAAATRRELDDLGTRLNGIDGTLKLVEKQFTAHPEPTDDEALMKRFSDGEIAYLMGDYANASVLFYDLVSDKAFHPRPQYADALFYLSDALYQQKNDIGSRLYLRQLLALKTKHFGAALTRYVEIAGRLNDFSGIDTYLDQARGPNGELPAELAYVSAKWQFKRTDLPRDLRIQRARAAFTPLAQGQGTYALQSGYFLGVLAVQEGRLADAEAEFRRVAQLPAPGPKDKKIRELANLSLGRVLHEQGKFDEAVDRYQEIPQDSDSFVDALYEIAWTCVKKGEIERAKNATDILLLVAPDSTLAPEAQILQGHLQLKLKRYGEATDTYGQVINTYAPVRDELDALLTVHQDPVAYFDELLARNERNMEVTSLLPPVAAKWATTQSEVASAVRIVDDLEGGRRGVGEGTEIAQRILQALETRGLEAFPALQEGYTRADALDSALTEVGAALLRVQRGLVFPHLQADERARLSELQRRQGELQRRFDALPTTPAEVNSRRERLQSRVDEVDKEVFHLGYEVQSMTALLTSVEKWVVDTRGERTNTPEEEEAFQKNLEQESASLTELDKQIQQLRKTLQAERARVGSDLRGEDAIRSQYADVLREQELLLERAARRAPGEVQEHLRRIEDYRGQSGSLRERVTLAKRSLRDQVARRGQLIREKVQSEQALLKAYEDEARTVSTDARGLVGRIAFDSFRRVRQQFYELVLKADVGIVDVAFTRKQDNTGQIQKLSAQKDHDLRALDSEFQEVLKDVE